jgi:hypothetical protein
MIAYLIHKKINRYIIACIVASIVSSISYQLIGFVILGYLDPFFLIASVIGAIVAFLIALLTGIPVVYYRKKG